MSTNNGPIDKLERDELKKLGYERTDLPLGQINKYMIWFFGITLAGIAASAVFYVLFVQHVEEKRLAESPNRLANRRLPEAPNPLLQSNITAHTDIKDLRVSELDKLGTYEWVDRNAGTARIPIDRSIELMSQRGMPNRPWATAPVQPVGGSGG